MAGSYKRPGITATHSPTPARTKPTRYISRQEIVDKMKEEGVIEQFLKLPAPTTLLFCAQKLHKQNGEWRLRMGYIKSNGESLPLWACLTQPCNVVWRYGINEIATVEQRPDFELVRPFCHLYAGSKSANLNGLDTAVAWYFVEANKWPGFVDRGKKKVSLKALKQACVHVALAHEPAYLEELDKVSRETLLLEECDIKEAQMADMRSRSADLLKMSAHFGERVSDMLAMDMTESSIASLEAGHDMELQDFKTKLAEYEQLYGKLQ